MLRKGENSISPFLLYFRLMERFKFHKAERLSSQKVMGDLFSRGESFLSYPLKVVFLKSELSLVYPAQVAFSASKRNFKLSVSRNILKRRMREAYRLNKNRFYEGLLQKNASVAVMFVFIGKEISDYKLIEKGMVAALNKIVTKLDSVSVKGNGAD